MAAVRALVDRGADVDLKCHGTPPIHLCVATAVQPDGERFAFECMVLLLERNANASAKVMRTLRSPAIVLTLLFLRYLFLLG